MREHEGVEDVEDALYDLIALQRGVVGAEKCNGTLLNLVAGNAAMGQQVAYKFHYNCFVTGLVPCGHRNQNVGDGR